MGVSVGGGPWTAGSGVSVSGNVGVVTRREGGTDEGGWDLAGLTVRASTEEPRLNDVGQLGAASGGMWWRVVRRGEARRGGGV